MPQIYSTPRFEVDFKTRLEQSKAATNAVRLPKLGYRQYRVYDIEEKKDKTFLDYQYIKVNQGFKLGPITPIGGSNMQHTHSVIYKIIIDEFVYGPPPHKVKWLKPKQATLLRLQGHRVEEI
jgi:hypothetical protein